MNNAQKSKREGGSVENEKVRMQQSRPLTRIHPLSPRRAEHLSEPVRLRPGAVDWVGVGVPREAEVLAT
uniref:Uncharacterized protein n=1 Tax=Knipowitschia caucasica TaxID=637954 RepID=A0AAV2MCY4_KNICA